MSELTEFERLVIRAWAIDDARAAVREAHAEAAALVHYLDCRHWLHWSRPDCARNVWGNA